MGPKIVERPVTIIGGNWTGALKNFSESCRVTIPLKENWFHKKEHVVKERLFV